MEGKFGGSCRDCAEHGGSSEAEMFRTRIGRCRSESRLAAPRACILPRDAYKRGAFDYDKVSQPPERRDAVGHVLLFCRDSSGGSKVWDSLHLM